MRITEFIVILLFISCIIMWYISSTRKCITQKLLPPKVVYRYRNELDLQFDPSNYPTNIYDNVFNGTNVAQGGYQLLNTGRINAPVKQG